MKKFILFALFFYSCNIYAQTPVLQTNFDISIARGLTTTGFNLAGRNLSAHVFTWSLQAGVMTSCTLAFQTSPNNVTWTTQTTGDCTSSGTSTYLIFVANYIRISATVFTTQSGTALVTVNYAGYVIPPTTIATITTAPLNTYQFNNIIYTNNLSGSDIGTRINACITLVTTAGTECNATGDLGVNGIQTNSTEVNCNKPGVTIRLGPTTITYTKRIWLTSNGCKIIGAGKGLTVLKTAATTAWIDTDAIIVSSRYGSSYFAPTTRLEDIEIAGITVDGNYTNLSNRPFMNDTWGNGIQMIRCYNCDIHNNEVKNITFVAINAIGVGADAGNIRIYQNSIDTFSEIGILCGDLGYRCSIKDNMITTGILTTEAPNGALGIWTTGCGNIALCTNIAGDFEVQGNTVYNLAGSSSGIEVTNGIRNLNLSGNVVRTTWQCYLIGILQDDTTVPIDVNVSNNNCNDAKATNGAGLNISGGTNKLSGIVVSNNLVTLAQGACYLLQNLIRPSINNNTCRSAGLAGGSKIDGIYIDASVSPTISLNRISGAAGVGINLASSTVTDPILVGNHLDNNTGGAFTDNSTRSFRCWNKEDNSTTSMNCNIPIVLTTNTNPAIKITTTSGNTNCYQLNQSGIAAWNICNNATTGLLTLNQGGIDRFTLDLTSNEVILGTSTATRFISNIATGTTPLVITSTTPVTNLATTPILYNSSGTQRVNAHIIWDQGTLSGGTLTVTLSGASVFTSSGTYQCMGDDITALAAVQILYTDGSHFVINGTGTDTIRYICTGN